MISTKKNIQKISWIEKGNKTLRFVAKVSEIISQSATERRETGVWLEETEAIKKEEVFYCTHKSEVTFHLESVQGSPSCLIYFSACCSTSSQRNRSPFLLPVLFWTRQLSERGSSLVRHANLPSFPPSLQSFIESNCCRTKTPKWVVFLHQAIKPSARPNWRHHHSLPWSLTKVCIRTRWEIQKIKK